ncbi:MFS transporter [Halogeometricum borinquense]|uniref:MFS transporter n=1 Tax=Halogeometricum borinquense TaxID=60847 RepID=A0A6C0UJL6_9EURY|nr:MFS transporter [Halogeometricum borinquense]QIB74491.1 MFS transporter [Halogeometricum borinquense]
MRDPRWRYYLYSLTETQGLIAPVWVLLLQARGLSYSEIGFLGALYWAVLVSAEIPTGYIGDRLGYRRSLFLSALVTAVGVGGLALSHTIVPFALALGTWAIGRTFRSGTADAWLYSALANSGAVDAYTTVHGRGQAIKLAATAATAVLGSIVYSQSLTAPFLLTALLLGGNAAIVLSFPSTANMKRSFPEESTRLETTWQELKQVFTQPGVRGFVSYTVLLFGLVEVTRTFVQPIVVGDQVGLPVIAVGVLYASFNIVAAGASAVTDQIERIIGLHRWFRIAPILLAASFVLLPILPVLAVPSFISMEAIWRVSQTFQSGVINGRTRDHRRATILSVVSMAGGVAAIVFRVVGGVLADLFGPLIMLAALALAFIVGGRVLLVVTQQGVFESPRKK